MEPIVWGAKVSERFRNRVREIAAELDINPDWLMACIAFESGETFSPGVSNAAGSGAVGLIQFMPQTAAALGTSTKELASMTAERQLEYVRQYFLPRAGKLRNLGDVYMAILWPAGIGKPDTYILFDRDDKQFPRRYLQNYGLDLNRDGKITRGEASDKVYRKLGRGLRFSA